MTKQEFESLRVGDRIDYFYRGEREYIGVVLSLRPGRASVKWTNLITGEIIENDHNDLTYHSEYVLVRQYESVNLEEFI